MIEVVLPLGLAAVTLCALVAMYELSERVPVLRRWGRHPYMTGIALGVYTTTWSVFGAVGYAESQGLNYLAIHLGATLSCLAIPVVWQPLARVVARYRFSSVADMLAYRFDSPWVGAVVTLYLFAGLMPYVALQTRALADAATYLAGPEGPDWLGAAYAGLLSGFVLAVGARHMRPHRQGHGLFLTLALEGFLKASTLLVVGGFVLYEAFGGPTGLLTWLDQHPEALRSVQAPFVGDAFPSLVVMSFIAMFLLPRQFHLAFVERPDARGLRSAMWVLPLYLLLMNVPIPVLLWGGRVLAPDVASDLYVLAAPGHLFVRLLAFVGAVAASSGMVLVSSIALSAMVVTHVVLPIRGSRDLSPQTIAVIRQSVVALTVLAGFLAHVSIPRGGTLVDLGLLSFGAIIQLAPGVFLGLAWTRATARGLLVGLACGVAVFGAITVGGLAPGSRPLAVWSSLLTNLIACFVVSLLGSPSESEATVAREMQLQGSPREAVQSVASLRDQLVRMLGATTGEHVLSEAIGRLHLTEEEQRPVALADLADEIRRTLAAWIGPLAARAAVGGRPADEEGSIALISASLQSPSRRGEGGAPLDAVGRNLLRVVAELPVGVCAAGPRGTLTVWNEALECATGVPAERALAANVDGLPQPWGAALSVALSDEAREREVRWADGQRTRTFRLTRAPLGESPQAGVAIVVEELTERLQLRREADHQARLASIGRLAAGVAHEIRNPLTGMLMAARNLERHPDATDVPLRLGRIVVGAKRIDDIVTALLTYARSGDADTKTAVCVKDVLEQAVQLAQLEGNDKTTRIAMDVDLDLWVHGQESRLVQVFLNLLRNARQAAPSPGQVAVAARAAESEPVVWVDVTDSGPGIPDELVCRLFEPFFTTKAPGEGTGLGLAICHRVIREHGGQLTYARVDEHTRFRVSLARLAASSSTPR